MNKLSHFRINNYLISWVASFLSNRTQCVKLNDFLSSKIFTNTGAPQGCVLSPILFTMYTNDCQKNTDVLKLLKFADDSSIQALIRNPQDEIMYRNYINDFTKWCEEHGLLLNISKTKELIIDFRLKKDPLLPIIIKDQAVSQVRSYKYLGVTIDDQLKWDKHASNVFKKANKRLYFLRKLRQFKIDPTLISLFYQATIQSILTFCIIGWGGNTSQKNKNKINYLIKRSGKLFNKSPLSFNDLLELYCFRKIKFISKDQKHPLFSCIKFSSRSGRVQYILTHTERYRSSFLPFSVKFLNESR